MSNIESRDGSHEPTIIANDGQTSDGNELIQPNTDDIYDVIRQRGSVANIPGFFDKDGNAPDGSDWKAWIQTDGQFETNNLSQA